jgi:trimethylamine--corrinoid protein Co-methyltransferase
MATSFGHPNIFTLSVAHSQLCRFYGLAAAGGLGLSDAKQADFQSGFERGVGAILSILAGGSIGPSGIAGTDEGASLEKLVIEDAAVSALNWIMRGIEITDEALSVDLIKEVGIGGSYLDQKHTIDFLRREYWEAPTFIRQSWSGWEHEGRQSIMDRAHREVQRILSEHYPPQRLVAPETADRLDAIVREGYARLIAA